MASTTKFSFGSILLLIIALVIFIRAFLALGPMYQDYWLLNQLLDQQDVAEQIRNSQYVADIQQLLTDRLAAENLDIPNNEMLITRSADGVQLVWTYETRDHFVGNVDFITTFQITKEFSR